MSGGGITIREAKIAQIAAYIGRQTAGLSQAEHDGLIDRFIHGYHPDRPCEYDLKCLKDGRCPMSPDCGGLM